MSENESETEPKIEVSLETAKEMLRCFEGYDKAYGTYDAEAAMNDIRGGKVEIKSSASTVRKLVTAKLWLNHLNGKEPLGVIPIRDNNTCVWGCIDIDQYGIDIVALIKQIDDAKLPLIVCGSKSGGAHAFLFMKDPVPAGVIQMQLREIAAILSYGGSEIFPKQTKVYLERGDLGTWLNMPYFGDTRWAYRPDGTAMPLEEFLALAAAKAQETEWFRDYGAKHVKNTRKRDGTENTGSIEFKDGPPCMQHLASIGIHEGSRNEGMMAFGVYAKKKYSGNWQEVLEQWNRDIVIPPLPSAEMVEIIKQLGRKEYFYPCKKQPIVAHCNSALCRTRKFGVASANEDESPVIGGLSVLQTTPPIWFLDVNGERIELTTEQLLNYNLFHKICTEVLLIHFQPMNKKAWGEVLANAMREVNKLEVIPEMGLPGQFAELLEEFVNNRYRGLKKEDILYGKPWLDDEDTVQVVKAPTGPKHFFRLKDLEKFLNEANFKVYTRAQMTTRITALGGGRHFFNIKVTEDGKKEEVRKKDRGVNVWWILASFVDRINPEDIPLPDLEPSPI